MIKPTRCPIEIRLRVNLRKGGRKKIFVPCTLGIIGKKSALQDSKTFFLNVVPWPCEETNFKMSAVSKLIVKKYALQDFKGAGGPMPSIGRIAANAMAMAKMISKFCIT